jgi:hypothetical protein
MLVLSGAISHFGGLTEALKMQFRVHNGRAGAAAPRRPFEALQLLNANELWSRDS